METEVFLLNTNFLPIYINNLLKMKLRKFELESL